MSKSTIMSLLDEQGKTAGNIVLKLGVSYTTVYKAMDGKCSRRVRLEIAKMLNKSPSFLWSGEIEPDKLLVDDFHYTQSLLKK